MNLLFVCFPPGAKVLSILVSYFIHMRVNVNGSFDLKNRTLTKPSEKKIVLIGSHMYTGINYLTEMDCTFVQLSYLLS